MTEAKRKKEDSVLKGCDASGMQLKQCDGKGEHCSRETRGESTIISF